MTFAWAPGDQRPSHAEILVDGRVLEGVATQRWLRRFDPSLVATWEELELAKVNYENCARAGHFGRDVPWETAGAPLGFAAARDEADALI